MIKIFLICFFVLTSCGVIGIQEIPRITKSFIWGTQDIEITKSFYENIEYSFVKVSIGKNKKAVLVLSDISNEVYTWVGANEERIYTKHGKLIKTSGLEHNISFIGDISKVNIINSEINSFYLELKNPSAMLALHSSSKESGIDTIDTNLGLEKVLIYEEEFNSKIINWSNVNLYYYSTDNGRIVKTIQSYHPNEEDIELTFYYK